MRWSGTFWWIGACITAALAGMLTYGLLRQTSAAAKNQVIETRPVVLAIANIPFRRSISETEIVIRELPVESIPEGAAVSFEQVVGKMATVDLFANQPILVQQLVTPEIVTQQVALSVPRGKVVTVVPIQSKLISNHLLRAGDHIDLLATFEVEVTRQEGAGVLAESVTALQDLEVHAIILPMTPPEEGQAVIQDTEGGIFRTLDEQGQSVLLALDLQDALTIRHILDVGGLLDLVLRAPGDDSVLESVPVDQFYLAKRYQLELVR